MKKQLVLVIDGIDAVIFNEIPGVTVAAEDCDEFIPIHEYMVQALKSEMDYDAVYERCDYELQEREVK